MKISYVLIGSIFVLLAAICPSPVQAQGQPGAKQGERKIIFVGGKKRVVKRKIKRVSPRDQSSINPQPLPPRSR